MGAASKLGFSVLVLGLILLAKKNAVETDTMAVGDSLTGNQTLTSRNVTFSLGFFNLHGTRNWYVGIWYARLPDYTAVWIANRENPLKNNSGTLSLSKDGRLVLSYGRVVIWSSNVTQKASSAVLTDAGNLVVHGASNKSEVIWQSFDNLGNTWLSGMKLGSSHRLSSWKNPWDPTPGLYNLQVDPSGANKFVLIWRNSKIYWDTGVWNGYTFSNIPTTEDSIHALNFFDNGTYKYLTYSLKPSLTYLSRFVLTEFGRLELYVWLPQKNQWGMFWAQPEDQCQVYALCGAYGSCNQYNVNICSCVQGFKPRDYRAWDSQEWSDGCMRRTALDCGGNRTSTDGFMELTEMSAPSGRVDYPDAASAEGCKAACLRSCSCTAYVYIDKCYLWFEDLLNLVDMSSEPAPLFVRLAAADVPNTGGGKKTPTVVKLIVIVEVV